MVGVSMGDENAIDEFRLLEAGATKPGRRVTGEELVVTAVHQDSFSIRGFDDTAVALLNIDEVYLEDLILFPRHDMSAGLMRDAFVGSMNPPRVEGIRLPSEAVLKLVTSTSR